MRPGAPAVWDEVPDNVPVDTFFGDAEATRRGVRPRRPRRHNGLPHRPCHRRADRAARRARRLRRRRRTATRSTRAAAARCGRSASSPRVLGIDARQAAGARLRRRRQFRHAQPGLRRVRSRAVGVAQARPAGQVHRDALGGLSQRLPGARSRHRGGARAALGRPLPRDARDQSQQCRRALRVALAALQGLGPDHGLLRHSRRDAARDGGLHQHHADPGLSQLRPAGGHLRDRAADRHRRRASSASTASRCGART